MKTSQAASRPSREGAMNFPFKPSVMLGRDVKSHGRRRGGERIDAVRDDGLMSKAAYSRAKQQAFASSMDMDEWNWAEDDDIDDDFDELTIDDTPVVANAKSSTKRRSEDSDDWADAEFEALDLIEAEHEAQRMLGIDEMSDFSK
jgi:hypothetical protein